MGLYVSLQRNKILWDCKCITIGCWLRAPTQALTSFRRHIRLARDRWSPETNGLYVCLGSMKIQCNNVCDGKGMETNFSCVIHFSAPFMLSEFHLNCAIVFVIVDIVLVRDWHLSVCLGFCEIWGDLEEKKLTQGAMGLFMLCAWQNAVFTALPYKHNGQATLNSTMEAKHSVLHAVYLHGWTSKTHKGKSRCVSLILHAFS